MAPLKKLGLLVLLLVTLRIITGAAAEAAPAPGTNGFLGDPYIGCLEMGLARCFAHPTLTCVEDSIVECSLQRAAPEAGGPGAGRGPEAADLLLGAVGGAITRGITNLGAKYINCVEADLAERCFADPTIRCVEQALGAC